MHQQAKKAIDAIKLLMSGAFRARCERYLRAITGNYRNRLVFQPRKVCTDGETVWADPTSGLIADLELARKIIAVRGQIAHEAFHILYTDFTSVKRWAEEMKRLPPEDQFRLRQRKDFLNIVEDSAIELAGCTEFPGLAPYIRLLNETAFEKMKDLGWYEENTNRLRAFMNACMMYGIIGQAKGAFKDPELAEAFERAKPHLDAGRVARTTRDRQKESDAIWEIAKPFIEEQIALGNLMDMFQNLKGDDVNENGNGQGRPMPADPTEFRKPRQQNSGGQDEEQQSDDSKGDQDEEQSQGSKSKKSKSEKKDNQKSGSKSGQGNNDDAAAGDDEGKGDSGEDEEEDTQGAGSGSDQDQVEDPGEGSSQSDLSGDEPDEEDDGDGDGSGAGDDADADDDAESDEDESESEGDDDSNKTGSGDQEGDQRDLNGQREFGDDSDDDAVPDPSQDPEDETEEDEALKDLQKEVEREIQEVLTEMEKEELAKDQSEKRAERVKEHLKNLKYSDKHANIKVRPYYPDPTDYDKSVVKEIEADVKSLSRNMTRRIQNLIRYNQEEKRSGLTNGYLNQSELWRKDGKIFAQKKDKSDEADLAILVLVDESGSMEESNRYKHARKAAVMIANVCEALRIPLAIMGHQAIHMRNVVEHYHYVTFERPLREQVANLARITHRQNTREGISLKYAAEYLMQQPQRDKLLLVISDGDPFHVDANDNMFTDEPARTDAALIVEEYEKKGMTIVGIAIGEGKDYIAEIYKNFISISKLEMLPQKLVSLIEKRVLKEN
jgi:Nitric oxide reductase activation protein